MFANKSLSLIVEDGYNTSYIDSLFVSMFFKPSYIQDVLSDDVENFKFMHLQDIIYNYFVKNMRCGYVINSQIMNEIRNNLIYCGWKNDCNIIEVFDVQELYDFIIQGLNKNQLTFNFIESEKKDFEIINKEIDININIDNNNSENNNKSKDLTLKSTMSINYINLDIYKSESIKNLLNEWIDKKFKLYQLEEIPTFIPIFLNRTIDNKYNESLIDIQEGIQLNKNNINDEQKEYVWIIHSIICYSKVERKYYSVIVNNKSWYLFKNSKLPSLIKIDIKDEDWAYKIKKECVFLFYTLDKQDSKIE